MRVWRINDGEWQSTVLVGYSREVGCVSMSAGGTHLVSGHYDKTLIVWHMRNGKWESVVLKSGTISAHCVSMNADGALVASGSYDNEVHV